MNIHNLIYAMKGEGNIYGSEEEVAGRIIRSIVAVADGYIVWKQYAMACNRTIS